MADRPRRIAELFAGSPYRVLSLNCMYDFNHIAPGIAFSGNKINEHVAEQLILEQAPIIYADDVITSLPKEISKKYFHELIKMIEAPRSIPPFDNLFIDTILPVKARSKDREYVTDSLAAFIKMDPLRYLYPDNYDQVMNNVFDLFMIGVRMNMEDELKKKPEEFSQSEIDEFLSNCKKLTQSKMVGIFTYYKREENDQVIGPWGLIIYLIGEDFKIVKTGTRKEDIAMLMFDISDLKVAKLTEDQAGDLKQNNLRAAAVAIQTISLLNCSNVSMVETGVTNKDLGRKRRDKDRLAMVRHHELRVKIGNQIVRVDGSTESGQSFTPLSPVRGHFKDYSTGAGLFGKYKYNCIWVPPYARGRVEDGIITRDYVLAGEDSDAYNQESEKRSHTE